MVWYHFWYGASFITFVLSKVSFTDNYSIAWHSPSESFATLENVLLLVIEENLKH